ncbi:hypothetical protein COT68_01050 [bacterium (Candidatus Torokbacteria) CG09_land_8_20_14_0_10_42_11]|nr:MAG: hypothetical protein COT68_01050 [bacterium (Candidatus Torokbacteria) CG09_land_8_20_14_0_10_42_11]
MIEKNIQYYFWASYRRKILDKLLEKNKRYYQGTVLDIGGRERGKFKKPKDKVEKWIFVDIAKKYHPDIVLDVAQMHRIKTENIDVINAIELFEHVEKIEEGIGECYRVLKQNGVMILSAPFLYAIHADPRDFQRWTQEKWKKELKKTGFKIEKFKIMGRYFTVLADLKKSLINSLPRILALFFYLFYPLLDLLVKLDNTRYVKNNEKLNKFHGGYFMVLRKR